MRDAFSTKTGRARAQHETRLEHRKPPPFLIRVPGPHDFRAEESTSLYFHSAEAFMAAEQTPATTIPI